MESKKPWQSKAIWVGVIVAIAPFIPGVNALIASNPDIAMSIVGAVGVLLRLITKDKISLKD